MDWRWAAASEIGTAHIRTGSRLQDAYAVCAIGAEKIFAVVSDGAGSAEFGAYGAWIVCRHLKICFREWVAKNELLPPDETLRQWITELRERIVRIAEDRGTTSRQFAATMAALIISPDELLAMQVGDSSIVGRRGSEWEVICWPENGEYASTTYFVTDSPELRFNIMRSPSEYDAFALFSDGVGDLALSYAEGLAHSRFFDPMMEPVDASESAGRLAELSGKLRSFLSEPSVCERTDDDKTLVLISGA